jgi:hypothetical protein
MRNVEVANHEDEHLDEHKRPTVETTRVTSRAWAGWVTMRGRVGVGVNIW